MFELSTKARRFILALAVVAAAAVVLVAPGAIARGSGSATAAKHPLAQPVERGWQAFPAAPVDLRFHLTSVWAATTQMIKRRMPPPLPQCCGGG